MKSVSYLRIEKRGQGLVVAHFSPAMAVVVPAMPGIQPNPGASGTPPAARADVLGTKRSPP